MRHTISVLVENRFGVLARVAGLFSSRGYNIASLTVGETEDPEVSRMTLVSEGDDAIVEQIIKQLRRLVDVIKVSDLTPENHVSCELALIKVNTDSKTRSELVQLAELFGARILDVSLKECVLEITGDLDKVETFLEMVRPLGIKEVARTGAVALTKGKRTEKA